MGFCFSCLWDTYITRLFVNVGVNKRSFVAIFITLLIHLLVIFFIFNNRNLPKNFDRTEQEDFLQLVYLPHVDPHVPDDVITVNIQQLPNAIHVTLPEIDIAESKPVRLPPDTNAQGSYELPNKSNNLYQNVFDPRLRKKLQESHEAAYFPASKKLKSWVNQQGIEVVEMGEGECMTSMPNISGERGTSWSTSRIRCGNSEGDRMMDNTEKDFRDRR